MSIENTKVSKTHKIFLIDDEQGVCRALTLLLQAIGYEARAMDNPEEALAFLRSTQDWQPDLILCDLRMPEIDGIGVLEALGGKDSDIPFFLISAHATEFDIERALKLGARGFLAKPFTPEQVHDIVSELDDEKQKARNE